MRQDEADRIEQQLDFEPDVGEDDGKGTWQCEECHADNSCLDGECQFCDGLSDVQCCRKPYGVPCRNLVPLESVKVGAHVCADCEQRDQDEEGRCEVLDVCRDEIHDDPSEGR